jgi:hypothetical protein
MSIFKTLKLKWWQTQLLKISMISFGIGLGAMFPGFFGRWLMAFWLLFLIPAIYIAYVWWRQ